MLRKKICLQRLFASAFCTALISELVRKRIPDGRTASRIKDQGPGGSRSLFTSVRKVNKPWIGRMAAINSAICTTAFLTQWLVIVSRARRTEYQLPSNEGLWKRSKCQRFLVLFWLCNMNLFNNSNDGNDDDDNITLVTMLCVSVKQNVVSSFLNVVCWLQVTWQAVIVLTRYHQRHQQ